MKKLIALILCVWFLIPAACFAAENSFAEGSALKKGFKGPEVRLLQQALKTAGYFSAAGTTENFGDATEKAVKAFQTSMKMTADGVAGKGTIQKLIDLGYIRGQIQLAKQTEEDTALLGNLSQSGYKPGTNHADIAVIQQVLAKEGLFDSKDGFTTFYGPLTASAVAAFQTKQGLTADGVAGKGTLEKMKALKYVSLNLETVSRGTGQRVGVPINWYDIKPKFSAGKTVLTVEDFKTGVTFKVQVSYCATVHADIETLTLQDTETVRKLWGGFSWDRRPVLIHFNGEVYAASMNGLPHAGLDNQPEGITVSGRSGDFGKGYNFDDVKGNGIDGHFCLHFLGSRTHSGNSLDPKHQENVRIAAGL